MHDAAVAEILLRSRWKKEIGHLFKSTAEWDGMPTARWHGRLEDMWALFAVIAAILWGVDYALAEKVLEHIHLSTLLAMEFGIGFIVMFGIVIGKGYGYDYAILISSRGLTRVVAAVLVTFILAHVCIIFSIQRSNATISGILEISYPVFIAFFSWFFYKENNVTPGLMVGFLFIVLGVVITYLFA